MFYELIGIILGRGGMALRDRHLPGVLGDERDQREFRQISLLLRRVAAVWPDLFSSLQQETEELSMTLSHVNASLRQAGIEIDEPPLVSDPLERYRSVNRGLEEAVIALHAHHSQPWAADALRHLRLGLARAAEIQGRLVDTALGV